MAPLPPGPPWKLVSPTCVLHIIHDEKSFTAFCGSEGLDSSNVSHLLGRISGNSEQPLHVKFWQPLQRLLFLRRHGCDELVPVLGGKGARKGEAGVDFFIASVAAFRDDMPFTAAHRTKLQQLLVESYRSNGKLSNNYMGWGLAQPPAELEQFFARVQEWRWPIDEQARLCANRELPIFLCSHRSLIASIAQAQPSSDLRADHAGGCSPEIQVSFRPICLALCPRPLDTTKTTDEKRRSPRAAVPFL